MNDIGDSGANTIGEGLKSNNTLTRLGLNGDEKEEMKIMNGNWHEITS